MVYHSFICPYCLEVWFVHDGATVLHHVIPHTSRSWFERFVRMAYGDRAGPGLKHEPFCKDIFVLVRWERLAADCCAVCQHLCCYEVPCERRNILVLNSEYVCKISELIRRMVQFRSVVCWIVCYNYNAVANYQKFLSLVLCSAPGCKSLFLLYNYVYCITLESRSHDQYGSRWNSSCCSRKIKYLLD